MVREAPPLTSGLRNPGGGGGGVEGWPAAPAWPQARPLPRDPWTLLLPAVQRAGVCPPLGCGLACKQAVSGAPESTPPFSPSVPRDRPLQGSFGHASVGASVWLWLVAGTVKSGGSQGLLRAPQIAGAEDPHILSPRGGRRLGVSSTSVRGSAPVPVGPWLPP